MWRFKFHFLCSFKFCISSVAAVSILASCTKDMAVQDKPEVMHEDSQQPDRRSDRPVPKHTVPLGEVSFDHSPVGLPIELKNGQRLYEAYCSECHDHAGQGHGMITQRGFPSSPPLASASESRRSTHALLLVIEEGQRTMPSFSNRLTHAEKKQIALYVQALQFAQSVPRSLLDAEDLRKLERAASELSPSSSGGGK